MNKQTEHEIYLKTKALLSSRDKWTKNAAARDKEGTIVFTYDPQAVSFCLAVALKKSYGEVFGYETGYFNISHKLYPALFSVIDDNNVTYFNDHPNTRYADVISALDKAAELTVENAS